MKKLIGTAALLLVACRQPAPEPTAPAAETTKEETATVASDVPAATPSPVVFDPAPAAPAQVAADDPTAVNQAIDDMLGNHELYQVVIQQFQKAVAKKDASTVASLVNYPFTATIDGKRVKIADGQAFVQQYDKIVTPAIASAITQQKYSQLMVNYKGVMFGSGEAWINGICKDKVCKQVDVRVVTIQPTG